MLFRSIDATDFVARTLEREPTADFGWTNHWCHKEPETPPKCGVEGKINCVETGGKGDARCNELDTRDDSLYLLEFTGGTGTAPTDFFPAPGKTVCVNKAVGGSQIGNWAISLNQEADVYMIDIRVCASGHTGSTNLAVNRDDFSYNKALSHGWSCGHGHTEANQLTYSPELRTWARLCWTDNTYENTEIGRAHV